MNEDKNCERLFPLISAWGSAIEQSRIATNELNALKAEATQDPNALRHALEIAILYQGEMRRINTLESILESDPEHPKQRQIRIEHLHGLMFSNIDISYES